MSNVRKSNRRGTATPRRGSVLVIVLVVILMLTFATYVFTQSMIIEQRASDAFEHDVRARTCVDSAIELTAAYLGEDQEPGHEGFYHRPELFRGTIVYDPAEGAPAGRFSIVAPVPGEGPPSSRLRFGLVDESSRLNLNTLVGDESDEMLLDHAAYYGGYLPLAVAGDIELVDGEELAYVQRERLMVIPNMTEELADSILDWIDKDSEPRQYGAEGPDYYEQYGYTPPNGPLESLDELLLVKGVTRSLLYGEDGNRNGLLDPNEDDGETSLPLDNADGRLEPGWLAYLTVVARERNTRTDGSPRINLNEPLLTELFDALEPELGAEMAQFITAFRIAGPVGQDTTTMNPLGNLTQDEQGAQKLAVGVAKAVASGEGAVTRAGLDLSEGGVFEVGSLYDLIDAEVDIEVEGIMTTLNSPWTSNNLPSFLADLADLLTTSEGDFLPGRINVNEARYETLLTVPGMTEELAGLIVKSAPIGDGEATAADVMPGRSTTGWLVTSGFVDMPTMRRLDRYLTARGHVFRAQVVGFFDHGGPISRVEVVLDGTTKPVRIASIRDLTPLGMGYPRKWLGKSSTAGNDLVSGSAMVGQ